MPTVPIRTRLLVMSKQGLVPGDFVQIWKIIQGLRKIKDAPVDLWGCDKVVDNRAPRDVLEFQIVVAAMLSSQTKDRCVKDAMDNLLRADLSVGGVLAMTVEEIDEKIRSVGFHSTKSRNIRAVANIIREKHGGRVPPAFDDLIQFPGIGPKMANMIMACAFNEITGITVDTHVHRITKYLGWGCDHCKPECKQPEHTRAVLQSWVPEPLWRDFTFLIVGLGQQSQSDRKALLSRCMHQEDPVASVRFLRRIKMNMKKFDLKQIAKEEGITDELILNNFYILWKVFRTVDTKL